VGRGKGKETVEGAETWGVRETGKGREERCELKKVINTKGIRQPSTVRMAVSLPRWGADGGVEGELSIK